MRLTDQEAITTLSAELETIANNISNYFDRMNKGLAFGSLSLDYFFDENAQFPEHLMRKEIITAMPGYKKLIDVARENKVYLSMILDQPSKNTPAAGSVAIDLALKKYADSSVFLKDQLIWKARPDATPTKPKKPRPLPKSPSDFGTID